jgi:translation initiation factor 2B subunit (eIF-2B alpha/beta/delta family)/8-oxo-dGTP pyrophosphatase MutT (NUDIX family)
VDDVVRGAEFLDDPLRKAARSRWDVRIAEDGDAHVRWSTGDTGKPSPGLMSGGSQPSRMETAAVVTCFLRHRGEVLLLRRSEEVGSYRGRWGAVAGHAEGDPDAAARQEIREETGLAAGIEFVRAGDPFDVEDTARGTRWIVHPYLFDCASRDVSVNYETAEHEWDPPTEILRRETVPDLWESYRRVRPTVETVRTDRDHGAAYLSLRALAVLRDRAAEAATGRQANDWDALVALARDLLAARPSMAVVRNRVHRAMHDAGEERAPPAVETAAHDGIQRAVDADERAAAAAADRVSGTVLTLSRSSTVRAALDDATVDELLVAASQPGGEGGAVAESFAAEVPTTLVPDAAVAHALAVRDVDAVLVGADTVLTDGSVVNKVGTRAAALAAAHEGVPVYAVAATDKVSTEDDPALEPLDSGEVYEGDAPLDVLAPTFDVTPPDRVELVTNRGRLDPADVERVAEEHRQRAAWDA